MRRGAAARAGCLAISAALLGGCASFSPDGGFGAVSGIASERLGKEARWAKTDKERSEIRAAVKALLDKPLAADDAERVALINNPALQGVYWGLGVAEADLVQASRLPNPGFSFKKLSDGSESSIERSLTLSLASAITAPLAAKMEARRFEEAKLLVANETLKAAAEARKAYYEALGAQQALAYAKRVAESAEAGAELASRMASVGNWSQLDLARERAFHAEALAQSAKASKAAAASRERLARALGLFGGDLAYRLPDRLPDLPAGPIGISEADLEGFAIAQRLDVRVAKAQLEQTAASLGLARATGFVNAMELGLSRESESSGARSKGYEISIEIPLFDWGEARERKAEALYMQSAHRLAETAVNARSEARESYLAYRSALDLALHYRDSVIPLRKKISDENLLRYNGMLLSAFELLADAREQAGAVSSYIEAQKEFWIADADLRMALGGGWPAPKAAGAQGETMKTGDKR